MNGWLAEDVTQLRLEVMKFKMTPVMSFSSFSSLVFFFSCIRVGQERGQIDLIRAGKIMNQSGVGDSKVEANK